MKKSGFSLMEILIVMAIIGVVTAMGISISQKGIEKAYRNYWYTAYQALSDATFDAAINDKIETLEDYKTHVTALLKLDASGTAPNGVNFSFANLGELFYIIFVEIPNSNTKNAMNTRSAFIYNKNLKLIYPAYIDNNPQSIDLQDRVDILPFIINEGVPHNYNNKDAYSFKQAYCMTHNNQSITNPAYTFANIACPTTGEIKTGVLQLIDPKKIY